MLTFSNCPIAAAVLSDTFDGGYFGYMLFANENSRFRQILEGRNGAAPFDAGLDRWRNHTPAFNLGSVQAAVR